MSNKRTSKQISKQIVELKMEINELRQSIEYTENVLRDKVTRVEENLESRTGNVGLSTRSGFYWK